MLLTWEEILSNHFDKEWPLWTESRTYKFLEKEKEYQISLEMAGTRKEDISISFLEEKESSISIDWKKRGEDKKSNKIFLVPLGDKEKVEAKYQDGVLTVKVPKVEKKTTSLNIAIQ